MTDEAHAVDPNRVTVDGTEVPYELQLLTEMHVMPFKTLLKSTPTSLYCNQSAALPALRSSALALPTYKTGLRRVTHVP